MTTSEFDESMQGADIGLAHCDTVVQDRDWNRPGVVIRLSQY